VKNALRAFFTTHYTKSERHRRAQARVRELDIL
jgi:hypothetical protein